MILLLRILLSMTASVVLVIVAAVIWLNTESGRGFAEREINHFAGPEISISGLAGHFPTDIKLSSVSVADKNGVWLVGKNLELRWNPLKLLHRTISVTALTAASLNVSRQPVPAKKAQGSSSNLPKFQLDVDRLAVPALRLGPALAGEEVSLNVTGAAHFLNVTKGNVTLNATTPDRSAVYDLNAGIDLKTVSMKLHVAEPPNGLLGHYAGPLVHEPLTLDVSVAGPRDTAALNFNLALGAAKLNGAGTLGLDPKNPKADVVLSVPALAPFGAIAGKNIAGSTRLHLVVAKHDDSSSLALDGDVALTAAPGGLAKLVGPAGRLSLLADLKGQTVNIQTLDIEGAEFEFNANGSVAQSGVNLNTQAMLKQVAALSPGISGNVTENGTIVGTPKDFAINSLLTGNIHEKNIPSGPFSISVEAQHLPHTPTGTLSGSGALENFPLLLDAAFARAADGTVTLTINNASWRSLNAHADLALAPGAKIPTGTAKFAVGQLGNFAPFSPVPLRGSVTGDFSYLDVGKLKLDLAAKNLVADPRIGAVNATLSAIGPVNALATRAQATIAKLVSAPARLALAGVFNLNARSAAVSSLSASWREINAVLQGPAEIITKPGIAVRHLSLNVNGGRVGMDGTLTPNLNATLNVQNLPASLARQFAPSVNVSGTLSATATLTGRMAAPNGRLTLNAQNIKLHSGPAAAMPAANFTGSATISGKAANINTKLTAGPNVALAADGLVPLSPNGALNLHVTGRTDLRLLDPILAVEGSVVRGVATADFTVTGNVASPRASGSVTLANGSVENIGSGLNLTGIAARVQATGRMVTLQNFQATAGQGNITGHGTVDLGTPGIPLDFVINAQNATPISSDIVTENLDAALSLKGALRGKMALGGTIKIDKANINIPKSLPPSVANLTIINAGAKPPPPPPPPPPVALDLLVTAKNQIFVRGDGLFAELGGRLRITGTATNPNPEGGFELIRGNFSLAGTTLQFTKGNVGFNGAGFMPTLDFEASTVTNNSTTATLIIGGTAAKPTITLTSTPPLPSDEILSQLLFGQSATNLSAFQAASLAAALAQLSGVGSGISPLDKIRNALGLDQLALGGSSGSGAPSVQAGRYVAPGIYVGATQATNGQGTQASVQINLYKGLKLETSTGTSTVGTGNASSVGLTYQFNY